MKNSQVKLVPFSNKDLELLKKWLLSEHVAQWFPEPEENLAWAHTPPEQSGHYIIECENVSAGYLRWQCVNRKTLDGVGLHHIPTNSADIDILIGDVNFAGKGLGVESLNQLVRMLGQREAIPLLALTTSERNLNARKAFTKAGFIVDSHYTVEPYGDCILMTQKPSLKSE